MRHMRLRKRIEGTSERPRLAVHFSGAHIYAQVIDDTIGKTVAAVCTTEKVLQLVDASLRMWPLRFALARKWLRVPRLTM